MVNDLTNAISQDINDGLNYVSRDLGLKEFYSLHVLAFCEGYYEPGPLANATVSQDSIWKNITKCSNRTALFEWNPRQQLQDDLDSSGHGYLNVTALRWPSGVDASIENLRDTFKATFVLYCIAIAFMFFAFGLAIPAICFVGRVFTTLNVIIDTIAFLAVAIASSLVTAVMLQGSKTVNEYGEDVGISAYGSSKLLAITWVATALMFVASLIWCIACFTGGRGKDTSTTRRGWRSRRRGPGAEVDMVDMKGHR